MIRKRKPNKPNKPKRGGVAVEVVASMCGLSQRRVQQLVAEGVMPRVERGKYNLAVCVRAYITYLQRKLESAQGEALASGSAAVAEERALKLRVERQLDELKLEDRKLARRESGYISVATAAAEIRRYQEKMRAVLLGARSRYANRIDPRLLQEVIFSIMRDLVRGSEEFAEEAADVEKEGDLTGAVAS